MGITSQVFLSVEQPAGQRIRYLALCLPITVLSSTDLYRAY